MPYDPLTQMAFLFIKDAAKSGIFGGKDLPGRRAGQTSLAELQS